MSNTLTQNNPYVTRFENTLKPLQSKLSKLETKLDSIDDDHPHKQQSRLNVLEEISKTKQEIENTLKNLECSKTITVIRSDRVPSNVEDHNVWNDCWYDEERKAFVTCNQYFEESTNARTRDIQIQYDKETGTNSGIIIEEEKIEFRFGYPVMLQEDTEENSVWFFLQTMKENMLTKDIVSKRLNPKTHEESILYQTEADTWIEVLNTHLTEQEYSFACEIMSYLVKTPMEVLKATSGRPYDPQLYQQQMTEITKS